MSKKGKGRSQGRSRWPEWDDDDAPSTMSTKQPTGPPPDPERVARAIAAITRLEIGVPESFTAPITHVVAHNGIFQVRQAGIGRWITKLEGLPSATGTLQAGFQLSIPKIPFDILRQIVAFFRAVCVKFDTPVEAYCQVWYLRDSNVWLVHVPDQEVAGGSVQHDGEFTPQEGMLHVADIHSHGSMSAFFSSVDDHDERDQGVRIFGVIGKIADYGTWQNGTRQPVQILARPELRWRIGRGNGQFMDVALADIVDTTETVSVPVRTIDLLGSSVSVNTSAYDPWGSPAVPDAWLDRVRQTSMSFRYRSSGKPVTTTTGPGVVGTDGVRRPTSYVDKHGHLWEQQEGQGWVMRGSKVPEANAPPPPPTGQPWAHSFRDRDGATYVVDTDRIVVVE